MKTKNVDVTIKRINDKGLALQDLVILYRTAKDHVPHLFTVKNFKKKVISINDKLTYNVTVTATYLNRAKPLTATCVWKYPYDSSKLIV